MVIANIHKYSEIHTPIEIDLESDRSDVNRIADGYTGTFDIVDSLATIEYILNSDIFLFAYKLLNPGGILIVNTPNISYLAYKLYSLLSGNRSFGEGHHIRFWNYRFLRTNLFLNGFTIFKDARKYFFITPICNVKAF